MPAAPATSTIDIVVTPTVNQFGTPEIFITCGKTHLIMCPQTAITELKGTFCGVTFYYGHFSAVGSPGHKIAMLRFARFLCEVEHELGGKLNAGPEIVRRVYTAAKRGGIAVHGTQFLEWLSL